MSTRLPASLLEDTQDNTLHCDLRTPGSFYIKRRLTSILNTFSLYSFNSNHKNIHVYHMQPARRLQDTRHFFHSYLITLYRVTSTQRVEHIL